MSKLRERLAEISEEIRHYPTPIARCDEQLTALLEERTSITEQLRQAARPGAPCPPENTWINDGGFHAA
jgi:chromosome segregation ATPase